MSCDAEDYHRIFPTGRQWRQVKADGRARRAAVLSALIESMPSARPNRAQRRKAAALARRDEA